MDPGFCILRISSTESLLRILAPLNWPPFMIAIKKRANSGTDVRKVVEG
jgi:hypothetical protein